VNTPLRRSGMARIFKRSHSFTCTPRIHPLTEWTIPAFAFPAEAGTHCTHLPTLEDGRLSWPRVAGWLHTEINVRRRELNLDMVAHLSTNWARSRLTSLIEANTLTTMPDHQPFFMLQLFIDVSVLIAEISSAVVSWVTVSFCSFVSWDQVRR